jgi:FAD/FMN-containing dehydrogenase
MVRCSTCCAGCARDNTGYHLSGLFCGAEGTLGIISAAVLKLFPQPREVVTALLAVPDLEAVLKLLTLLRTATGGWAVGSGVHSAPRAGDGAASHSGHS